MYGGKMKKNMKHGGKPHKEEMTYGGGAGMMKKNKKNLILPKMLT